MNPDARVHAWVHAWMRISSCTEFRKAIHAEQLTVPLGEAYYATLQEAAVLAELARGIGSEGAKAALEIIDSLIPVKPDWNDLLKGDPNGS